MTNSLKNDVVAGFSVFLLALPLCLGIAIASNFPPIAGVLTAIVGGILASFLGGAQLSIKGPAAGLIVIVLGGVHELGEGDLLLGYKLSLAVGVVAALLQILIAVMKKAIIAEIMPPSVVQGMLAAIGAIVISKQSYVMAGITPTESEPFGLLFSLPFEIAHLNPVIFGLGLLSFAIIMIWPFLKKLAFIPASIVVLCAVIPLSIYFNLSTEHQYSLIGNSYSVGPRFLINLPMNFFDAIQFPDFSRIYSPTSLKYVLMFTLVGSIESLLTVCAVDSIAKRGASSDLNKDLRAVGIANLVASLIGGLPMISEIVRSKANIDYGATSAKANFFHGVFMLIAVIFLPSLMNLIPLSALAALLVFVGIKLASPKEFIYAYEVGKDQFVIFLTTFVVTLAVDLLAGVAVGVLLKLVIHTIRGNNLKKLFNPTITVKKSNDCTCIQVEGPLTFVSYLKLKKMIINAAPQTSHIIINLDAVTYLDHTVLKKLKTLSNEVENVTIIIEENQEWVSFYNHPLAAKRV
jgi:MFS superfamily sulfate permease-like transporter